MSLKKIKNYFDPRENLILTPKYESEDESKKVQAKSQSDTAALNASIRRDIPKSGQSADLPLMTELQKENLSFETAQQIGMHTRALDYQREIRERALKMHEDQLKKQSYFRENRDTLAQLYDLSKEIEDLTRGEARSTFSTYGSAGIANQSTAQKRATDLRQQYSRTLDQLKAKLKDTGVDAQDLLEEFTKSRNQQVTEKLKNQASAYAGEHPIKSTLATFPVKVLTAPDAALESVAQHIEHALDGNVKVIDTNAPEFAGQNWVNTTRGKVSEDIDERYESNLPNWAYEQALSLGDNLMSRLIGYGTGIPRLSSAVQGITKFADSVADASNRGATSEKAVLTGAWQGANESLGELVGIKGLEKIGPITGKALYDIPINILKQSANEGLQEITTEILDIAADRVINQDKSSIALEKQAYINQGMSESEATKQILWDAAKQVANAGVGGALTGGLFGAGAATKSAVSYNAQMNQIGHEALQSGQYGAQLRNALQFDPSSPIGQAAIKMVNRDKTSNKAAGRFVTQYDRAASEAIQRASSEQEVRDAYRKFSSNEDPHGAIVLSKMADERTRALAAQKVDGERAQEQQNNETSETAVQSTAIEGQAAPRVATSAHETQTRSESNRTTGEYFKRDGTAWRGESGQHDTSEAVSGEDIEIRYATTHLAKLSNTGEQVAVMDVANTDGDMEVLLSNGRTAKLGDLQFDKNEDQILYSMAKQFPTAKARAFVNNYNGSISPENYTRAFNVLYEAGYQGKTSLVNAMQKVEGIPRERKKMLSFLYLAGENRAAAEAKAKQERQPVERGSGRFVNKTGEKLDEAMQLLYMGTAAKTGMTIELRNQIQKDANGAFDAGLSRILLSQNADNQIATLVHETAEYVREYNPEGMLDVQEAMLGWYARMRNFETLAEMVEDYRNRYEGQLGEESAGEAMGEMTHDAMSALFVDEAAAQNFLNWLKEDSGKTAAQQKNILQTIVELFDRLIEKISEYLHGHSLPTVANVFAEGMDLEQMAALRQMFFEAADQARENYDAAEKKTAGKHQATQQAEQSRAQAEGFVELESVGKNKTSVKMENGEEVESEHIDRNNAKYSLNPEFEEQYDQWDKKDPRWKFKVGTTSEALKSIGMPDKKIVWDSSKIIKIKAKHSGMTDSVIKQVPHLIEFPVLVMKSKQSDSRITMFGEIYDRNRKPVLGVIELQPTQNGILMDEFKVASAYGKDHAQRFINSSEILYVEPNKNRTHTWLRRTRLQLPVGLNQYGPIGSIARTEEDVNSAASTDSSIRAGEQNDTSSKSTKYMFAGEKARTANRAALERAQRETESELHPSEMIRRSTGWHKGPDGKWRFEIDDSKAQFGDESSNRLGDFLLHEELYEAYPELREIKVEKLGEDAPKKMRGRYIADEKKIQYDPNLAPKDRMKTLLHEIQHIIQRTEEFGKGGSRDAAKTYLFNRAYDYAKTLPSYRAMQTPEQKEQFVKDLIAARSRSGDYETAVTEAYRNLFGEIEARNTANRQPLDQRGRQLASPISPKGSLVVTDWAAERKRYSKNKREINGTIASSGEGLYNQDKGGEMHDEQTGVRNNVERDVGGRRRRLDSSTSPEKSGLESYKPTVRSERGIGTEPGKGGRGIQDGQRSVSGGVGFPDKDIRSEIDQSSQDAKFQLKDAEEKSHDTGSGKLSNEEIHRIYKEALAKWGSIKPGYKPFREIKVPKKTSDEKKVRRFVRSVMESNAVTDEMAEDLKGEIVKEAMSYTPISDKQAQDTAKKLLKSGVDKAWRRWNAIVDGDSMPQKSDIALGEYLLRLAAENGDKSEVVRLTAEISELGTRAGQNVQALSMLKKMTGIGQLVYVQRTVDTLNKDLIRRFKGKAFAEVKINEKLAEDLVNAKTPEEVDAAAMEIYKDVADQLPPTWIDKWNAWRYLSMLGNTKTHIRNILGNAVFAPVVRLKDAIGAGIEAASIKSGERTKVVTVKQEYKEFAKQDFDQMQDVIKSGGKMNPTDVIRDQRTIFKTRWLETLRKKNFEFMEIEDGWFLKAHYESALAQYLQANKTDLSKMTEGQLERARNYAIQEAQRATFRDASPVASAIQRASNTNKALNVLVEGILPFKKTPVNVLKRGVEYSPAGLLYTLSRGSMQLKRGEITASQYIDGLASGLTGTGLTALGALLCGLGWVSGGFGDDKEDKFAKLQGRQEYALRIGDFTYTIDWMAPSAIPFFIGVELMAALQGEYEDAPIRAVIDAIANIMEPMFNLSMLDSLNNTINAVSFADNKLTAMIQEVITSYFMQAIPALSGHIARTVDPTRRRTYIDKNSWIPESMQRTYQKLFNKIPGLSYLNQPYIDEWGREDKTQNIVVGAFENFLSPGWFSEIRTSDMEQELLRLYEATGESGVLPGYAAKFITVDGEKINFTGDEYTQFSEIRGQTAYSTISEIMSSEEYESMSDAQKVQAVKDAFEFAGSAAKAAVSEYELEGWQQDANEESQEEGIAIGESIAHRAATDGAAPEIASILQDDGAEAAQEKIDRMMKACDSRDEMRDQKGNVKSAITRAYKKQYIKLHKAGDVEGMRKIRQELMELRTPVGKLYTMKDFRNWIE